MLCIDREVFGFVCCSRCCLKERADSLRLAALRFDLHNVRAIVGCKEAKNKQNKKKNSGEVLQTSVKRRSVAQIRHWKSLRVQYLQSNVKMRET